MKQHTRTQNIVLRALKAFRERTGIGFSTGMTGKMAGMLSLSTSPHGERCRENSKRYEVCKHCYSKACDAQYKNFHAMLMQNLHILTTRVVPVEEWVRINYNAWRFVRLESFGDVNNVVQVVNYFNLCKANPKVTFSVWTKNIDLYYAAIQNGNEKPANLIIIASSPMLNRVWILPSKYYEIVDKVFTVYTYEHIKANGITPCFINCGARSCKKCQRCYHHNGNGIEYVNEILKSDSKRVHAWWASMGWVGVDGDKPHMKGEKYHSPLEGLDFSASAMKGEGK